MAAVGFNETVESQDEINVLWEEAYQAARELLGIAHLSAGSLMVVAGTLFCKASIKPVMAEAA